MRLIDADALKARFTEELFERSGLSAQGIIDEAPTIEPSGDLISRADVFEIIDKAFSQPMGNVVTLYADICLMLNVLPTHANSRSTHERDLISRADAIEAVKETILKRFNLADWYEEMLNCGVEIEDRINALPSADAKWIPCSERLPKEDEYVGNVCKYYLIQDEYGDMHVAHLSGRGWETIESVKALGCDVVAWMPLPKPYKGGDDE